MAGAEDMLRKFPSPHITVAPTRVNVATYPVLAVPLWAFSAADRATLRLPVIPPG